MLNLGGKGVWVFYFFLSFGNFYNKILRRKINIDRIFIVKIFFECKIEWIFFFVIFDIIIV